jgi:hypothetical protein
LITPSSKPWMLYEAFGLVVASDRSLPFARAKSEARPDLFILLDEELVASTRECFHAVEDYRHGPALMIYGDESGIDLDYDLWRFSWTQDGHVLRYRRRCGELRTDWDLVLERVVLPIYRLTTSRHLIALHGSAVEVDGRAWIFLGDSGVGKSTTAHALLGHGARHLGDDMTLVELGANETTVMVLPGCPVVRLWRDAGDVVDAVEDRPINDQTSKRWFRLREELSRPSSVPLEGVLWLRRDLGLSPGQGRLERFSGQAGLAALLRQTFDYSSPRQNQMIARFRLARQLIAACPLHSYDYGPSPTGEPSHVDDLWARVLNVAKETSW